MGGRRQCGGLGPVTACLIVFSIFQFGVIVWLFHNMSAGGGPAEMLRNSKARVMGMARGVSGFHVSMSGAVDGSLSLNVEDDPKNTPNNLPDDSQEAVDPRSIQEIADDEASITATLQHAGEDCWVPCGRAGVCEWCGSGYACCRDNWAKDPAECAGNIAFISPGQHECVKVQAPFGLVPKRARAELAEEQELPIFHAASQQRSWKTPVCDGQDRDVAIQIHILAWKRPQSLYVLMEQLRDADYSNWDKGVSLFIHVDGGADPLTIQVAEGAHGFVWPHGQCTTDVRTENNGLREMWLSSLRTAAEDAGPNTLMIVLEDDMRVSSIYFQWVRLMIDAYGRNRGCRHDSLMGFSLSSVRLMEMRKPFKRWRVKDNFPESTKKFSAYISSLPSSWGGAYWSDRWLEFDEFVSVRMRPAYYDIAAESQAKTVKSFTELALTPEALYVPGARSNWWPGSWKRFMVDFTYGCGLFMLYPNLEGENALASTLSLQGKHSLKKDAHGNRLDDELAGDSQISGPRKIDWTRKPQIAPLIRGDIEKLKNLLLPDITVLQMTTLWMEPSTIEQAVATGVDFVHEVIANENFSDLGLAWCASVGSLAPPPVESPIAV